MLQPPHRSAGSLPLYWTGRALSALVVFALTTDGLVMILLPRLLQKEMEATGFPISQLAALGSLTLICAGLYAFPRTAPLGAVLVTGFLGGAICLHFRLGHIASPPQLVCFLLGIMAWGGLYLRDSRIRALLPVRSTFRHERSE
jgi:hypothetical protein